MPKICFSFSVIVDGSTFWKQTASFSQPTNLLSSCGSKNAVEFLRVSVQISSTRSSALQNFSTVYITHSIHFRSVLSTKHLLELLVDRLKIRSSGDTRYLNHCVRPPPVITRYFRIAPIVHVNKKPSTLYFLPIINSALYHSDMRSSLCGIISLIVSKCTTLVKAWGIYLKPRLLLYNFFSQLSAPDTLASFPVLSRSYHFCKARALYERMNCKYEHKMCARGSSSMTWTWAWTISFISSHEHTSLLPLLLLCSLFTL